jgi:hypothetical protein
MLISSLLWIPSSTLVWKWLYAAADFLPPSYILLLYLLHRLNFQDHCLSSQVLPSDDRVCSSSNLFRFIIQAERGKWCLLVKCYRVESGTLFLQLTHRALFSGLPSIGGHQRMSLALPLFIDFRRKGPTKSLVRAREWRVAVGYSWVPWRSVIDGVEEQTLAASLLCWIRMIFSRAICWSSECASEIYHKLVTDRVRRVWDLRQVRQALDSFRS